MKIRFYGTGASEGFPALFCECEHCRKARQLRGKNIRTRSCCGVNDDLLIDASADTYLHALYGGLDLTKIQYILFTHSHDDHFYPGDIRCVAPPYAEYSRKRELELCGNETVMEKLDPVFQKESGMKGVGKRRLLQAGREVRVGAYRVLPLCAQHDPNENCLLYVVQRDRSTLLFAHDTGSVTEDVWRMIQDFRFDCVVLDCTCGFSADSFPTHMNFEQNIAVKKQMLEKGLASPKTIFIASHFAHSAAPFHEDYTARMKKYGFLAAYDGMSVEF